MEVRNHGILEWWNDGIMGFEDKREFFSLCNPIFHYSNIPSFHI
jgi:hypothetical protein